MTPTFAICIASHGEERWHRLAMNRAFPSADVQGVPVLTRHDPAGTRADVRNALAERAEADYLIFLDADDELKHNYVESMRSALMQSELDRPLLVPRVSYIHPRRRPERPKFWPEPALYSGNWMVVGTGVSRELFFEVGGWRTFTGTGQLNEYDDWDLWIRCQLAGASPLRVPNAIYYAYVAEDSPHRVVPHRQKEAWVREIQRANWPKGVPV